MVSERPPITGWARETRQTSFFTSRTRDGCKCSRFGLLVLSSDSLWPELGCRRAQGSINMAQPTDEQMFSCHLKMTISHCLPSCPFSSLRIPSDWLLVTISLRLKFLKPFPCQACPVLILLYILLLLTPTFRLSLTSSSPCLPNSLLSFLLTSLLPHGHCSSSLLLGSAFCLPLFPPDPLSYPRHQEHCSKQPVTSRPHL